MAEYQIEKQFIQWLNQLGYMNSSVKTEDDIKANIIDKLSAINNKVLNGRKLLPEELNKILRILDSDSSDNGNYAYQFSRRLQGGIRIDNLFDKSGNKINIKFVSNTPSDNYWEVASQIVDNKGNRSLKGSYRYDVTLLLNGFPVVQIELKDSTVEIGEAINQINKYIRSGYTGIFKYLQLFIISNDTHTRYGMNNNTELNEKYMLKWSDDKNNILDTLNEFTHSFLEPSMLFSILTNFIIRYGDKDGKQNIEKPMIVMRPYQIYAVKKVMRKIKQPLTGVISTDNGYIFHTTGSGKTLTSWKCAQIAAEEKSVSKVVFLVDRKDLDEQTISEFKSIDAKSVDLSEDVNNTKKLLTAFRTNKLIVTTIQKFSNAIKNSENGDEKFKQAFEPYRNTRVVFIIDECHRTQFGDMHTRIKRFFKCGQYIGFTGTPIKEANKPVGGRVTAELFGEELHTYHIGNAIKDNNVLGFAVEYHRTFRENELLESMSKAEKTTATSIDVNEILLHTQRIKGIVDTIYRIHNKKTVDRNYTALFAVQSIQALILYYNEFKRHNDELDKQGKSEEKLKVSAIFTASDNNDQQLGETSRQFLDKIILDFNNEFETNCQDIDTFRPQLAKRLKAEIEPCVDIVIVVGIFLTGFDSKRTNTLYVDKNLEYHGLLQAFSRTNRVETGKKRFGNIVCFRPNLNKNVDDAIELFSSGSQTLITVTRDFTTCLTTLEKLAGELINTVPKDLNISSGSVSIEQKRNFILAMREFGKALIETKQFEQFNWEEHIEGILPEKSYNKLIGELKTLNTEFREQPHKESILDYVDFCMELVSEDKIDYDYIQNLLNHVDLSSLAGLKRGCNRINELIEQSNNDTIRYKRELIKKFLEHLTDIYESGEVRDATDVNREFRKFVAKEKSKDIRKMEQETSIPEEKLRRFLNQREIIEKVEDDEIREEVKRHDTKKMGVIERRGLMHKVKTWIDTMHNKFFRTL